jgi:pimeloyl-[acyl-carrier protein] methyl ester esterase
LLQLADPRPSGEVLATGLRWLRDVDLRAERPGPARPSSTAPPIR